MRYSNLTHVLVLNILLCACESSEENLPLPTPPSPSDDCGDEYLRIEGMEIGDCTDGTDNDGDGYFDCDDSGCFGSPDCDELELENSDPERENSDPDVDVEDPDVDVEEEIDSETDIEETEFGYSLYLGNGIDMEMSLIPAGTFTMGSPANEVGRYRDEEQHEVTLSNDFYVMTTEVTQGMFYEMMGYDSRMGEVMSYGDGDDYPAYYVSWHMSAAFANAVTKHHNDMNGTELSECYSCINAGIGVECEPVMNPYECDGYRLLTEAEWEYAARAETTAAVWTPNGGGNIPQGEESSCHDVSLSDGTNMSEISWYCGNAPTGSREVGLLTPNDYGLYDMIGNVWEWTHDYYAEYGMSPVTDPVTTSGTYRVFRGGYWGYSPYKQRSAERSGNVPKDRRYLIGFRLGISG